jgi:hypothetical protein
MAPWWWPSVATSGLRVLDGSSQGERSCQRDEPETESLIIHQWYRWVTLAMLAYAFLAVAAVTEYARPPTTVWAGPIDLQRGLVQLRVSCWHIR